MAEGVVPSGGKAVSGRTASLVLGALGVVYGDIGTSPLYTFKTALEWGGGTTPAAALGILSLIIWTLIVTTSIKYVALVMRADNDGEGGILALMSLLGMKHGERRGIVALGVLGAALLYGDGAITPAISVLSAIEGLKDPMPWIAPDVVPIALGILVLLFLLQRQGTAAIGRVFGPVMVVWFLVIGGLGLNAVLTHPAVLAALDPRIGLDYLASHGLTGVTVLGAVFLSATGAEALYADMGHFGAFPIRLGWYGLVLPALVLCYAGQTALVAGGAVPEGGNPFFLLGPASLRLPMVGLATVATVIASQSIISGVFSMTRQAIQLGLLPRMTVTQTSEEGYGQIYVGGVNWLLMFFTICLTFGFGSSDSLAAAFGIAVSLTMLLTTMLIFVLTREIWGWPLWGCFAAAGPLALVDCAFVGANLVKVLEGGWVPLVAGAAVYTLMDTWHGGRHAVLEKLKSDSMSFGSFVTSASRLPRVRGTAVYLNRRPGIVPPAMLHTVKHFQVLHERNVLVHVKTEHVPRVGFDGRVSIRNLGEGFWAIDLRYGFMEHPNIPKVLERCRLDGEGFDMMRTTFFLSHETITRARNSRMGFLRYRLFEIMQHNAAPTPEFYRIPPNRMVELGAFMEL